MTLRVSELVRQQVRERAGQQCEYCRKPEMVSLYPFHVDHIIPPVHGGDSELSNLAWACFQCNVMKGSNIASYDLITGELTPLYHPRIQRWLDHFRLDGASITGITPTGRVTVRVLQMNHPDQLLMRQRLLRAGKFPLK